MSSRLTCLLTAVFAVALPVAGASAAPLGFGAPVKVDDQLAGGEPVTITDLVHHTLVYSSHEGTTHLYRPGFASASTLTFAAGYRNQVNMWLSKDDGKTFKRVDYLGGTPVDPSKNTGFSDPDFTQDAGGRIYNTGIDLANQSLFSSNDGGATWDKGTPQCAPGDRPWLAGGKKDEVFLSTDSLVGTVNHQVFQSTDGGNTCSVAGIKAEGTTDKGESWLGTGKLFYDRASDNLFEPSQIQANGSTVGVGIDVWHRGDQQFTLRRVPVATTIYAHWPSVAQDDGGTIYLAWDTNPTQTGTAGGCNGDPTPAANKIMLAATHDFGKTWSAPIAVAAPSGHRVFWPWVVAGEAGRINVTWYETDNLADLACQKAKISVKTVTVTDADRFGAERMTNTADAVGRPIADNNICQSGTTCVATGEDRRLGDFFTNGVGADGCAEIASGDTSQKDPITGGDLQTARPIFVKQTSGPRLRGSGDCSGAADAGSDLGLPPATTPAGPGSAATCGSRRVFTIHLRAPHGVHLRSATITVAGHRIVAHRSAGRLVARVDLRGLARGRYTVAIRAVSTKGQVLRSSRRYRTCTPGH